MQRYNQPAQQFIFSVDKDIVFAQQETLKPPLNTIGIRRLIFFILFIGFYKGSHLILYKKQRDYHPRAIIALYLYIYYILANDCCVAVRTYADD